MICVMAGGLYVLVSLDGAPTNVLDVKIISIPPIHLLELPCQPRCKGGGHRLISNQIKMTC